MIRPFRREVFDGIITLNKALVEPINLENKIGRFNGFTRTNPPPTK